MLCSIKWVTFRSLPKELLRLLNKLWRAAFIFPIADKLIEIASKQYKKKTLYCALSREIIPINAFNYGPTFKESLTLEKEAVLMTSRFLLFTAEVP